MIFTSKNFNFNNKNSTSFEDANGNALIINASLQNDMYMQPVAGSRKISEQQISGRDEPYFYAVDSSPIDFTMNIALSTYATKETIREILRWLLTPKTYKPLSFDGGATYYYVIFYDKPKIHYIGKDEDSTEKYLGYIEIQAQTNSPYLFTGSKTSSEYTSDSTTNITVNTDADVYPDITIYNESTTQPISITITNNLNNSSFGHTEIPANTKLVVKGLTKEIYFTNASNVKLTSNAYIGWSKKHYYFSPVDITQNSISIASVSTDKNYSVILEYREKRFI